VVRVGRGLRSSTAPCVLSEVLSKILTRHKTVKKNGAWLGWCSYLPLRRLALSHLSQDPMGNVDDAKVGSRSLAERRLGWSGICNSVQYGGAAVMSHGGPWVAGHHLGHRLFAFAIDFVALGVACPTFFFPTER